MFHYDIIYVGTLVKDFILFETKPSDSKFDRFQINLNSISYVTIINKEYLQNPNPSTLIRIEPRFLSHN